MSSFNHNNGNISYTDHGEGSSIILIHGFGLDKRQWEPQVQELVENGHRVITYDMRGFGESDLPSNEYSHQDDLNALLDHVGIDENVHLVGSSFGALTAMELAIKHAERAKALTLLAPSPGPDVVDETSPFPRFGQLAKTGNFNQLKEEMLAHESMAKLQHHPDALNQAYIMVDHYLMAKGGWHFINKDLATSLEKGLTAGMKNITCTVQILIGSEDYKFSREAAVYINEQIPNSHLHEISGFGHLLNLEAPHIVNEAILKFDKDI